MTIDKDDVKDIFFLKREFEHLRNDASWPLYIATSKHDSKVIQLVHRYSTWNMIDLQSFTTKMFIDKLHDDCLQMFSQEELLEALL